MKVSSLIKSDTCLDSVIEKFTKSQVKQDKESLTELEEHALLLVSLSNTVTSVTCCPLHITKSSTSTCDCTQSETPDPTISSNCNQSPSGYSLSLPSLSEAILPQYHKPNINDPINLIQACEFRNTPMIGQSNTDTCSKSSESLTNNPNTITNINCPLSNDTNSKPLSKNQLPSFTSFPCPDCNHDSPTLYSMPDCPLPAPTCQISEFQPSLCQDPYCADLCQDTECVDSDCEITECHMPECQQIECNNIKCVTLYELREWNINEQEDSGFRNSKENKIIVKEPDVYGDCRRNDKIIEPVNKNVNGNTRNDED